MGNEEGRPVQGCGLFILHVAPYFQCCVKKHVFHEMCPSRSRVERIVHESGVNGVEMIYQWQQRRSNLVLHHRQSSSPDIVVLSQLEQGTIKHLSDRNEGKEVADQWQCRLYKNIACAVYVERLNLEYKTQPHFSFLQTFQGCPSWEIGPVKQDSRPAEAALTGFHV